MATITIVGRGDWKNILLPSADDFINELRARGWQVLTFRLTRQGWSGGTYDFDGSVITNSPQDEQVLRNYFEYYFDNLTLALQTSGTMYEPAPNVGGGGGLVLGFPSGGGNTYTVVRGDTFNRIAAQFNITPEQLANLNPQITNRNRISVGQVLRVSGAPSYVTPTAQVIPIQQQVSAGSPSPSNQPPPKKDDSKKNWFDKTFFDGAGALTGAGIGVLVVLGVVAAVSLTKEQ